MNKIIIIGAGPIGCYLARLLKNQGLNPLIIEEHKSIGRPIHCAGLVGKKVFDESKIDIPKDCIINTISGAVIYFEDEKIEIKRKEVAYIIDRERFDKVLGENLDILFETKFLGLEKNKSSFIIETDRGDFKSEIVIGADGANSFVRNILRNTDSIRLLRGVQFRMRFKPIYKDMVEVYIKKPYFYWIIPESDNVVRVGVISENPYYDLLNFIEERKLKKVDIIEKFAGIVPLEYFTPIQDEKLFLVGDSASQIKPLTYGGIYMGMRGAEILLDCIIKEKFSNYTFLWFKRFGREIKIMYQVREVLKSLDNREIKRLFLFVKDKIKLIEEKADFENHSTLFLEILKNPFISKDILNIFLKILKLNF